MSLRLGRDGIPEQGEFGGLAPVARSAKWGESYPVVYQAKDGQYFVPEKLRAGNVWSSANVDDATAKRLGGSRGNYSETVLGNRSNPYGLGYGAPDRTETFGGYWFSSAPDAAQLESTATFRGGRGVSNKSQLQGLALLGAAVTGGASLAPTAAGAGLGSGSIAPGLAAATGQTAQQIAAVAATGTSAATPAALAAATSGSGVAASSLSLASVLGGAKTAAETAAQLAGTVGVVKALQAGASPSPDVNLGDVFVPGGGAGGGGGSIMGGGFGGDLRAPAVEVIGKPDNMFWILLAAGAALIWRVK
jgi:hypothetical protein